MRIGDLNDMFIHFICFCPLAFTIKLNFNVSKVTYFLDLFSTPICNLPKNVLSLHMQ